MRISSVTPTDCSPERLMQLVRSGSAEALDQITRCYSARLLAAGRRHCRTAEEAQDAVHDAWLTAAQNLASLRDDHRLEGWLVKVVASACRRIGRGHKNDAERHESEVELSVEADPEQEAGRRELARLLDEALLSLSAEDRSMLLLAELEDFSAAEIAAELGMTDGAVRTRLSRLRRKLVEALQRHFEKGALDL